MNSKITNETRTHNFKTDTGEVLTLSYTLCRSARRTYSLQISPEGELTVRVPRRMPLYEIAKILDERSGWILSNRSRQIEKYGRKPVSGLTEEERARQIAYIKRQLKPLIEDRIRHYEPLLPAWHRRITSVTIRSQKTRWGSCSSRGTLSFNWKLYLAPVEVLDYVIVHELSHLCEMNHSDSFWALVERLMPDYRIWYKWLKQNGGTLDI